MTASVHQNSHFFFLVKAKHSQQQILKLSTFYCLNLNFEETRVYISVLYLHHTPPSLAHSLPLSFKRKATFSTDFIYKWNSLTSLKCFQGIRSVVFPRNHLQHYDNNKEIANVNKCSYWSSVITGQTYMQKSLGSHTHPKGQRALLLRSLERKY